MSLKANLPAPDYYREAQNWREELYLVKEKQISLYRALCIGLFGVFTLSMIALTILITRESVQPFLAIMDKRTGEVTTATKLNADTLTANWKMVRYFVKKYVNERESYDFLNINEPYQAVMTMSTDAVKAQIDANLRPELNPESPIKKLGQHHYMKVTINSVAKLARETLLDVRFTTHLINSETHKIEKNEEWRVTLKWTFQTTQKDLSAWDKNPLGFTVTYYDKQPVVS
ncbi:MAG: type IV secretion system protein [Silvanigrellaceae bacterium]|nr:type IV secretion system protein [Silvanigrellaceae bacterium]